MLVVKYRTVPKQLHHSTEEMPKYSIVKLLRIIHHSLNNNYDRQLLNAREFIVSFLCLRHKRIHI